MQPASSIFLCESMYCEGKGRIVSQIHDLITAFTMPCGDAVTPCDSSISVQIQEPVNV